MYNEKTTINRIKKDIELFTKNIIYDEGDGVELMYLGFYYWRNKMQSTPKGMKIHIGIFGKRNVGKSSILNALTKQDISIVSSTAGTTTDPVEKSMELLPLGPVLFVDTAGIDDEGALGL